MEAAIQCFYNTLIYINLSKPAINNVVTMSVKFNWLRLLTNCRSYCSKPL
jgi:hypothetical protein